jgi:multidrug efflux system membrane fusion protein
MKRHALLGVGGIAVVALGLLWRFTGDTARAQLATTPPLVPVTTSVAQRQDVPVFLDGLGTVQAFNVVEIKAQVGGILTALPAAEGQEVHKGDTVAEIDPRPFKAALDQATAQRGEDTAMLQSAQLDLKRFQDLAKREFAPVQQVDDQQATVNKEISAIAADDAAIETAQINLGYCVIRAPFDGRVSLYQLDVGNLVQVASQTGIISITQDKPISVVFTLPENELLRVQEASKQGSLPVLVTGSDDQKTIAAGVLMTPNNTIDTATGTISLKAKFDNQDDHLWPGQFVNARVQVQMLHNVVTIPSLAVEHGPEGLFTYVTKPDRTVAQVGIQVGYQGNGLSVVTKGLSGNETVVVSGQARLAPGVRVQATDASKAPASAAEDVTGGSASPG